MAAFAVKQIDHVEVMVKDMDSAVKWYEQVLGLKETHRWTPEPVFLEANGTALALFLANGPRGTSSTGAHWHRVAWRTDRAGFDAAQQHLRDRGIRFRGPIDHDIAFSIYFDDLDGNPLEITYYTK